jgi:hypothetical protein
MAKYTTTIELNYDKADLGTVAIMLCHVPAKKNASGEVVEEEDAQIAFVPRDEHGGNNPLVVYASEFPQGAALLGALHAALQAATPRSERVKEGKAP